VSGRCLGGVSEVSGRFPRKYAPEVSRKCLGRVSAIAPTESTPTTRQCDRSAATWQADSSREEEGGGPAAKHLRAGYAILRAGRRALCSVFRAPREHEGLRAQSLQRSRVRVQRSPSPLERWWEDTSPSSAARGRGC